MPSQFHQFFDWDQSRKEQGNWPTKTIVNMWIKNETNLATMIGLPKIVEEEMKKKTPYKIREQEVAARLEVSSKRNPWRKRMPCSYKGLKAVGGDESKINVVYGKLQISFFVGGAMTAKFTPNLRLFLQSVQSSVKPFFEVVEKSS